MTYISGKCPKCGRQFYNDAEVGSHYLLTHTPKGSSVPSLIEDRNEEGEAILRCPECPLGWTQQSGIRFPSGWYTLKYRPAGHKEYRTQTEWDRGTMRLYREHYRYFHRSGMPSDLVAGLLWNSIGMEFEKLARRQMLKKSREKDRLRDLR